MNEKNSIALSLKVGFSDGRDRQVLSGIKERLQRVLQKEGLVPYLLENDEDLCSDSFSITLEAEDPENGMADSPRLAVMAV